MADHCSSDYLIAYEGKVSDTCKVTSTDIKQPYSILHSSEAVDYSVALVHHTTITIMGKRKAAESVPSKLSNRMDVDDEDGSDSGSDVR